MKAQDIFDTCDLLVKTDCLIINETLYEKCTFNELFKKEDFQNSDDETYYLNDDNHVYRVFFSDDDYDYVTDESILKMLNKAFA